MSTTTAAIQDRAAAIIPTIVCSHPDDAVSVGVAGDWELAVAFADGTTGIVHMNRLIHADDAGVFAALRDPELFKQVSVELGAVTWANGLDLAPDAMYSEIRQHGEWVL